MEEDRTTEEEHSPSPEKKIHHKNGKFAIQNRKQNREGNRVVKKGKLRKLRMCFHLNLYDGCKIRITFTFLMTVVITVWINITRKYISP